MIINKKFEEHYKKLLGENYNLFLEWSFKLVRKSIRINTIKVYDNIDEEIYNYVKKVEMNENIDIYYNFRPYPFENNINIKDILSRLKEKGYELERIRFYKYGFWINNFRDVGTTIEYQLGYYYPQEAASMIPPIVLDPKKDEIILDLAAAPGSKTTQIAMHMENRGIIIANDVTDERISALADNLQRQGVINTIITKMDGRKIDKLNIKFDKVLLDAPCSASGAIRKSYRVLNKWNENSIKRLSNLQKQLILKAFDVLKEGGILVYSTCSIDVEEDEEVVDYLLKNRENAKIEKVHIPNLKSSDPILEYDNKKFDEDIKYTLRLYPWDNDTEGFYIAKIRKI